MQEIDAILDEQTDKAPALVKFAIRHRQADEELQSFNDNGKFKFVHRLTVSTQYKRTQIDELKKLKKENPELFLNEITNNIQNIRRIESDLKKAKYKDEAQHQSWIENLSRAKIKQQIFVELM